MSLDSISLIDSIAAEDRIAPPNRRAEERAQLDCIVMEEYHNQPFLIACNDDAMPKNTRMTLGEHFDGCIASQSNSRLKTVRILQKNMDVIERLSHP